MHASSIRPFHYVYLLSLHRNLGSAMASFGEKCIPPNFSSSYKITLKSHPIIQGQCIFSEIVSNSSHNSSLSRAHRYNKLFIVEFELDSNLFNGVQHYTTHTLLLSKVPKFTIAIHFCVIKTKFPFVMF